MSNTDPVASFRIQTGGYASMHISDDRVANMLTRSELLALAADATATAAQITASTPATTARQMKRTR